MPDPRSSRERTEELERASLSAWATLSADSKGREIGEEPDPLRSSFTVDSDRIMACTAFERLKDKTHSLLAPRGEGYRSRLDHTLRGVRVARWMARALRLNEDLTEAIAAGCDLGATAFARAGDQALSLFTDEPFRHNHQSARVVERLERGGEGLNLTWEVRDGIACHTTDAPSPATREGEVVRLSQRVAQCCGEVADALSTGVVLADDLPTDVVRTWGSDPVAWVQAVIQDTVRVSTDTPEIRLSPPAWAVLEQLEAFVNTQIVERPGVGSERARGSHCLSSLMVFYLDNPGRLPAAFRTEKDPTLVRVIDFVSSISDGQALRLFNQLFLPRRSPHRL
ncbi:MAG: deoxyguanosinetriphosphate triphosphohydrolase [Euzebya sp.]